MHTRHTCRRRYLQYTSAMKLGGDGRAEKRVAMFYYAWEDLDYMRTYAYAGIYI